MQLRSCFLIVFLAVSAFCFSLLSLSPAAADCTSSAGVTLCSQGDVHGSDTGDGPSGAGPYMPYPCEYDYLCNDYGDFGVAFDLDAPDIGRPNRPERPDRPSRPHRPRGGRR